MLSFLLAAFLAQQTPGALAIQNTNYHWQQTAQSLTEAQGYTYKAYVDAAAATVLGTTCTATSNGMVFDCTAPIGPQLVGTHSVQLTASSGSGESPKSTPPLVFTLAVVPAQPQNLRVGPRPPDRPAGAGRTFPGQAVPKKQTTRTRVVVQAGAGEAVKATSGGQPPQEYAADNSYFLWEQEAPSVDVLNNEWFARAYIDASPGVYVWAYCTGTAAAGYFACSAPVPTLANGQHVAAVTYASDVTGTSGGAVESPKSVPLMFSVQVGSPIPTSPFNLGVGPQ